MKRFLGGAVSALGRQVVCYTGAQTLSSPLNATLHQPLGESVVGVADCEIGGSAFVSCEKRLQVQSAGRARPAIFVKVSSKNTLQKL